MTMLLPPGYVEADIDRTIDNLKHNLDLLLDAAALGWFNFGMMLRCPRLANLNIYIPTADRLIG